MRIRKPLSATQTLELINKPWATVKDIMNLGCCGSDKACKIKKEIVKKKEEERFYIPAGYVPMESVIEYLNINLTYLRKIAKLERSDKDETKTNLLFL